MAMASTRPTSSPTAPAASKPGLTVASPSERIAIWQDKLKVQNDVAPDGKIKQKIILLTGKRPCFIDNSRGSSIDSAQSIKVLLVPQVLQTQADAQKLANAETPADADSVAVALTSNGYLPFAMSTCSRPAKINDRSKIP